MTVININENNFEEEVVKSSLPYLVDFWAEWCGPCKNLAPILEEISDELKDKVLECLSHDPISVDELARFCHVSAGMINAVILELELSGGIQRHYGNKVSRAIDMPQSID